MIYFTAIEISRVLQVILAVKHFEDTHRKQFLENDNLPFALLKLVRILTDYVLPSLIFCISSHPIDFHVLLIHNAETHCMRSIFVKHEY